MKSGYVDGHQRLAEVTIAHGRSICVRLFGSLLNPRSFRPDRGLWFAASAVCPSNNVWLVIGREE